MIKRDEIEYSESCLNKAHDDERLFVLLARDPAAPIAIRAWVAERIRIGKNGPGDDQILQALDCATRMEHERVAAVQHALLPMPMVGHESALVRAIVDAAPIVVERNDVDATPVEVAP